MSIDALQAKIRKLKNPSMIGLDPTVELLPPHLLEEAYRTHGQSLEALAAAYEIFCGEILQALQGLVPAVKVQSYCFDALGSCGIAAMLLGLWLKAEDRKKNYGLELPNIKK